MTGVGKAGAAASNYANAIGTSPTKIEKKFIDNIIEHAKDTGNSIKDSAKNLVKTPTGKAIVAGIVLSPIIPVVGPAIALGGAAAAALKFIKNSVQHSKAPEAKSDTNSVLKTVKKAAMISAGAAAGAVGGIPGMIVAGTITKAAIDSTEMKWAKDLESKVAQKYTPTQKEVEKYQHISDTIK